MIQETIETFGKQTILTPDDVLTIAQKHKQFCAYTKAQLLKNGFKISNLSTVITFSDVKDNNGSFFFSTDHCQPNCEDFVPCTHYKSHKIFERHDSEKMREFEIKNPDPRYQA